MAIEFDCPCGERVCAPDTMAGKKGKCPSCGRKMMIPTRKMGERSPGYQHNGLVDASSPSQDASNSRHFKECPYCGETIKSVARKCRFCGEILEQRSSRQVRRRVSPRSHYRDEEAQYSYEDAEDFFEDRHSNTFAIGAFIFGGLGLLMLIVGVIFFLQNRDKGNKFMVRPAVGNAMLLELEQLARQYTQEYKPLQLQKEREYQTLLKDKTMSAAEKNRHMAVWIAKLQDTCEQYRRKLADWVHQQHIPHARLMTVRICSGTLPDLGWGKMNITFQGDRLATAFPHLKMFKGTVDQEGEPWPVICFEKNSGTMKLRLFITHQR